MSSRADKLHIVNAHENNLKHLDLELPHDKLVVVTGLSGSGKSSLAFDTVYAEGQRRYVETFSSYTRQFLDKMKKPAVDAIEHSRPSIAIQQRTRVTSSRSTVGSLTNINEYLKLIWTNFAKAHCPQCEAPLHSWTATSLATELLQKVSNESAPCLLISPISAPKNRARKLQLIERLLGDGFNRFYDPARELALRLESPELVKSDEHSRLLVVVDRVKLKTGNLERLKESIGQCFNASKGVCLVAPDTEWSARREYRDRLCCQDCGTTLRSAKPSLFTYNHPLGACQTCRGFGKILSADLDKCVPDRRKSIAEDALQCWTGERASGQRSRLLRFCKEEGIPIDVAWNKLKKKQVEQILHSSQRSFKGLHAWFKQVERKAYKMHVRMFLSRYRGEFDCPDCNGSRLKPEALCFRIDNEAIAQVWQRPVEQVLIWLDTVEANASTSSYLPAELSAAFAELRARLSFLRDLGLPYLTLDRQTKTLSGGETQRVNLAAALGSELVSTQFVLDEPSVGLHPRDTARLVKAVQALQRKGNSVLMVEHDLDCIAAAEEVIELGPRSGDLGGEVIFQDSVLKNGELPSSKPFDVEPAITQKAKAHLEIRNATARNLCGIDLDIPLNRFVCLTGVSGSGKSSLAIEVIQRSYDLHSRGQRTRSGENAVRGFKHFDQLLVVDQAPLAKSPRANIATYSGLWDVVRTELAATDEARQAGFTKSAFSFNVEAGRCPLCKGAGAIREDMQFLSDVFIECELCGGKRFQSAVLQICVNDKNVFDFLNMTVDQCAHCFQGHPSVESVVETLDLLGLGHLRLGHSLSQLSGGEAQRLKLVPFIQKSGIAPSFLILDEPTTGLANQDVKNLVELILSLRSRGHSILCIEHNLSLITAADWLIDLGPEGGEHGGQVLFEGSPSKLVQKTKSRKNFFSYTGEHLAQQTKTRRKTKRIARTRSQTSSQKLSLRICGAKEHNLKDIDVTLPLNQIVALTGVSGSGKSTIAKDIIYAEGQRRYLDCLSPYARQFIKELKKPEISSIQNVVPTVYVGQHTFRPGQLSTVATLSEVYSYLRLLFSKTATQHCPEHDEPISPLSAERIAEDLAKNYRGSVRLLAPVILMKKGQHKAVFQRAIQSEIDEVRVDGTFCSPASGIDEPLSKGTPHTIEFTVARFNPSAVDSELIRDAVHQTLSIGGGRAIAVAKGKEFLFNVARTCPICNRGFFKPDPEDLSFNSKRGQCTGCYGRGVTEKGAKCSACNGTRINAIARSLRLETQHIGEVCRFTPPELRNWLDQLSFDDKDATIAETVLPELYNRIEMLEKVGIDYIALDRDCNTLSAGELQRLRLTCAATSSLSGAMYIFDEPSASLHPYDNLLVLDLIRTLKDNGNSVLTIEHDSDTIRNADYVLDIGPEGGRTGGRIEFAGTLEEFLHSSNTVTAQLLREEGNGNYSNPVSEDSQALLTVSGAGCNNIASVDLNIPLQSLVSVAGVSGAGKTTLVHEMLLKCMQGSIPNDRKQRSKWKNSSLVVHSGIPIERVVCIDQKPIGKNSRSTPASYLKIWDEIRKLFASSVEAKAMGYGPGFFSFNSGKGRCAACKGQGSTRLEMSFLPDAFMLCEECSGTRYGDEANSIRYLDLTISEALELTIDEARNTFKNHRKIHQVLKLASESGLGYLTLGQPSSSLSGGESQRIKLVAELSGTRRGHTFYVLDEPSTGLHKADVAKLLSILRSLVRQGHSVLLIEHDPDIICASDHIIELGPGAGPHGGQIVFSGNPQQLGQLKGKKATAWSKYLQQRKMNNLANKSRKCANC